METSSKIILLHKLATKRYLSNCCQAAIFISSFDVQWNNKHARVKNAYRNVLFLLLQDISWTWHTVREKRLQGKFKNSRNLHIFYLYVPKLCLTKVCDRFSDFAVQNATQHSKRRRTHVKPNGPKLTVRLRAKSWRLTHHSSSRSVAILQWNTTENYGQRLSKRWRRLRRSDREGPTIT